MRIKEVFFRISIIEQSIIFQEMFLSSFSLTKKKRKDFSQNLSVNPMRMCLRVYVNSLIIFTSQQVVRDEKD